MEKIDLVKIVVNCDENTDKEDLKCGGPAYLGFDFFVKVEDADKSIKFIKQTFKELNLYYGSIDCNKDVIYKGTEKDVWTEKMIYDCIEDDGETVSHTI